MSRRFTAPVEVHTRADASGPVPDQFLWRGRLYVVREVLARWTESGSWWRGTSMSAVVTGEEIATTTPVMASATRPRTSVSRPRRRRREGTRRLTCSAGSP